MDARRRNVKSSAYDTKGDADRRGRTGQHSVSEKHGNSRLSLGNDYVVVFLVLLGLALVALGSFTIERYLPLPDVKEMKPADFDYRNARTHLTDMTDIGPRVVGSHENEVLGEYSPFRRQ